VVSHGLKRPVNTFEDALSIVGDGGGFSMHKAFCADNRAAESLSNGLVTKADAEKRY